MEQGKVFRQKNAFMAFFFLDLSIPLEQGKVFRPVKRAEALDVDSFNPFGTGQGLSTIDYGMIKGTLDLSIPLEQGKVFRQSRFSQI